MARSVLVSMLVLVQTAQFGPCGSKLINGGKVDECGAPAALWGKLLYLCNLHWPALQ